MSSRNSRELYALFVRVHNKYSQIKKNNTFTNAGTTVYPAEMQVLCLLENNNDMTVSRIAEDLHISNSAASQLVKKLSGKKLLCKKRNSENERIVHLYLNKSGKTMVDTFFNSQSIFGSELDTSISTLSAEKRSIVISFLRKIEEQFDKKLEMK